MAWSKTTVIGPNSASIRTTVKQLSQNKSANTTRINVKVQIYKGVGSNNAYSNNVSTSISGSVSASKTVSINVPSKSWRTLWDQDFTVKHAANGTKSISITGTMGATGTSTFGKGGSAKITATLPRLVLAPTAPAWGSTTYANSSSIKISWTNKASARGPYSNIEVQRWSSTNKKWVAQAKLSGTATSYTGRGLPANAEVRYRIRARGIGGTSGWVQGGTLGTTPAAASSLKATKSGQNIALSWKDNAAPTARTRRVYIDDSPDGGSWVRVGEVGGSATSWTHSKPDPSKTHKYRVWTRIVSGGIDLTSTASAVSNTVQLQAPPNQPTRVRPRSSEVIIAGDPVTVEWVHNPVDTTAQTAAEVKWRPAPGTTTTTVTGKSSRLTVTPDLEGASRHEFGWNVRTKGDHPDWSPIAYGDGILISTPPSVVVQDPVDGGSLDVSRVTVVWGYEPNGDEPQLAQADWRVTLYQDDADGEEVQLEQQEGSGTTSAVTLDARLANETEYRVTVQVANGDGLWSALDEATFTTDFPTPPPLEVTPEWSREDGSVSVMLSEVSEDSGIEYRWTGEAHESTSERVVDGEVVRVNLAENPSFENSISQPGLSESSSYNGQTSASDEWSLTGTQSVRIDPTEDSDGDSTWYVLGGTDIAAGIAEHYGFAPGKTFTIGATIHLEEEQTGTLYYHARRIRINAQDTDGVNYWGSVVSDPAPNEPGSHRVVVTFTVPEEASGGITVNLCNGSRSTPVWWDGLTIEEGATPGTYFDGDTPLTTDVVWADVERRDEGGEWVLIASGLDPSTSVVDRTPRLGKVEYRAVSRTTLPTETAGEVAVAEWVHDSDPFYVNGGANLDVVCRGRGSEANDEYGIEQASHQFAGRSRPTPFFGEATEREVSATGRILHTPDLYEVSHRQDWVDLLHEFSVVCFRDCRGRKVFGLLQLGFDTKLMVETVQVQVSETEWEEGVVRVSDLDLERQGGGA